MSTVIRATKEQMDFILYFLLGALPVLQATHAPLWAKEASMVTVAGLVAWKAKRSKDDSGQSGQGK